MNWRRGFIRLWSAVSIFWVFAVGLVQYSSIYQDWQYNQTSRPLDFSDLIPKKGALPKEKGPWDQFADAPVAPPKAKDPWAEFPPAPGAPPTPPPGMKLVTDPNLLRQLNGQDKKLVPVDYDPFDKSFWGAAKPHLMMASMIMFLPPTIVFFMGWILAWIIAGFRQT